MLKSLHLTNFTVFADAEFEFGPRLNVLVGTNGTGKTHVLKAGYVLEVIREQVKSNKISGAERLLQKVYADKGLVPLSDRLIRFLPAVFVINERSSLVRNSTPRIRTFVEGVSQFSGQKEKSIRFQLDAEDEGLGVFTDSNRDSKSRRNIHPVFIPAKEALTLGWLPSLYGRFSIPFDETYIDLLRLLSGPPLRQPEPVHIIEKLTYLIGGKVEEEGGHFYLAPPNQPRLEMNLVAEGMRKFATLYKLLVNGTLTSETTLFWDEPEANLNPALLKEMAVVLTDLAQAGFQIILATHSLFLMRELHILAQQKKKPVRYFGLYAGEQGDVQVETTDDLMQLQHITALDAELAQTFDFEAALDQDYAGDN